MLRRLWENAPPLLLSAATCAGAAHFALHLPEPIDTFVATATHNHEIRTELGSFVVRSPLWRGQATDEHASVAVPLHGPRASATLQARAYKRADGSWEAVVLTADTSTGKSVDLLGHAQREAEAPPKMGDGGSGPCNVSKLESI